MLEELEQQSNKSTDPGYTQRGQLGGYITRGDAYKKQGKLVDWWADKIYLYLKKMGSTRDYPVKLY